MKGKALLIKHKIKTGLISDIRQLIESARSRAAVAVNVELTLLYWRVGERIRREILKSQRAEYGEEILPTLSAELMADYGKGFDVKNLWRMVQFAEHFSTEKIVVTLSRQLSWSHFVAILPVKDSLLPKLMSGKIRIN